MRFQQFSFYKKEKFKEKRQCFPVVKNNEKKTKNLTNEDFPLKNKKKCMGIFLINIKKYIFYKCQLVFPNNIVFPKFSNSKLVD